MTGGKFCCEDRAGKREERQAQQKWREDYKIIEKKKEREKFNTKGKGKIVCLK